MTKILCEFSTDGESWSPVGEVGQDDMMGSFTDVTSGRDVYLFGWRQGRPGLFRAIGGTAENFGELTKVETFDLEPVSPLLTPHEMVIVHPTQGMIKLRLSRKEE